MTPPLRVAIAYAREDEPHGQVLGAHLAALVREGLVTFWRDRRIERGEPAGATAEGLRGADLVLLLVSADLLASGYCDGPELAEAARMHEAGEVRVVAVILRSCEWERTRLARFDVLPADGAPAVESAHPDREFTAIARGLREIARRLTAPASASPAAPPKAPAHGRPTARRGAVHIGEVSLFGLVKVGPLTIPLPAIGRRWLLPAVAALMAAAGLALLLGFWVGVRRPMAEARDAMRTARYDLAQAALERIPAWLARWPAVARTRADAALGASFLGGTIDDAEALRMRLASAREAAPADVNLKVIEASDRLAHGDRSGARELLEDVVAHDPLHAEAWFLLGQADELDGDVAAAIDEYGRAADAAPASPVYRVSLARTLLDRGDHERALLEYEKVRQLPLARVEAALAHWASGGWLAARDAQRDAVKMLDDPQIRASYVNARAWVFFDVPDYQTSSGAGPRQRIALGALVDKRCYAVLEEAASRRLAGESSTAFPPQACTRPAPEVAMVVAHDLCRFVEPFQPASRAVVASLKHALGLDGSCPEGIARRTEP